MAEGGGRIEDKLNEVVTSHDKANYGVGPENEVFRSFEYKSPKDKKAAAKYLKRAVQEWADDPKVAEEIERHELGHALADKKTGQFSLKVKAISHNGPVYKFAIRPSYHAIGPRTLKELHKIIESGEGPLPGMEVDRQQIELLEREIKNSKKWWQFWKK